MRLCGPARWLTLVILTLGGCRTVPAPETLRDHIALSIRHGDLKTARAEVDRALLWFEAKSPEWSWRFREQKAHILVSQGDSAGTLAILGGDVPPSLARTDIPVRKAMLEGMAYRISRDFQRSEERLAAAQDLAQRNQPQVLCEVLNFKGALLGTQGRAADAEEAYEEALQLARENGRKDQEVSAEAGLAWVSTQRRRFDESAERGQEALSTASSLGMQGVVAATLGNLAWNYLELGDFESALDFFNQSAEASSKNGMPGYSAYWFSGVADASMALRDYKRAEDFARTTLASAGQLKDSQTEIVCLNTLSDIMLRTDRLSEAEKFNQEALTTEAAGQDKAGVLDSWTMAGRIDTAKGDFPAAEAMFQRVLSDPSAGPELRWVSYAGLARAYDGQGNYAEAEKFFLRSIDTIEQARNSINHDELRLSFLNSGIAIYGQYVDFLVRRNRSGDALRVADFSRARTLGEGLGSGAKPVKLSGGGTPPERLAQRLNATLLFYWLGERQSHLWVITPSKTTHLALPGSEQIDPLVKSYGEALLRSRDPLEASNSDGQKLYAMLVEPVKQLLPKDARVILLPDGSLYGLNFETLIVPDPKPHYWIEDVTLTTANSLTLLASAVERAAPKDKSLFLVGNTVSPSAEFPALPQAEVEMQDLEKYFPEAQLSVLTGSQATPDAYLKAAPEKFSYVHFVTHGTASRARPLESAVVLSKEKDADAFKLYARDIVKRRLSAYLVTISACNGSGTRAYSGEGLVGLSWAFLRAGAHFVIGALWEVSDSSTPQLMDSLYAGLGRGQDPASALRAAKLSLLHSDGVYRKPFYWAPFQLYAGS